VIPLDVTNRVTITQGEQFGWWLPHMKDGIKIYTYNINEVKLNE
jgi:hypothetical protein